MNDEDLLQQLLASQSPTQPAPQAAPQPTNQVPPAQVPDEEIALLQERQKQLQQPQKPYKPNVFLRALHGIGQGDILGTILKGQQDDALADQAFKAQQLKSVDDQIETVHKIKKAKITQENLPAFKEMLAKEGGFDKKLIDKFTLEGVQEFFPNISKAFEMHNNAAKQATDEASKAETARHNKAEEALTARGQDLTSGSKESAKRDKAEQLHGKSVDESIDTLSGLKRGANAGTYGMGAKRGLLSADGLRTISLIESGKVKSTTGVANELAANLAGVMTSGGHPAEGTIKAFVDKSFQGDVAKASSWLVGHPKDTITKSFLNNLKEQFAGQQTFWNEVRDDAIRGQYEKFRDRFEEYPELKSRWVNSIKQTFPDVKLDQLKAIEEGKKVTASGLELP